MAKYWSFSAGRKGVSRVRVYERSVSPVLYVEWTWKGERHQRSLRTTTGHPVTDKKLAKQIAHEMSRQLERDHHRAAHAAIFGEPTGEHTVADLLLKMHQIRTRSWSDGYRRNQETLRNFWVDRIGDLRLTDVTEAGIEAITADAAEEREWGPRSLGRYRQYMAEAMTFAAEKLKWIEPKYRLTALDIPKAKGKSLPYSLAEVRRLLPALEQVDPRAGWIGHVAWQSGRRLKALRTFPTAGVTTHKDHAVLAFPGATDKARQSGEVVVVGRALELTRKLLLTAGKHLLGDPPPTHETCIKHWLKEAEKAAGVPYVRGRGWHGLKRRYATETHGLTGRDKQAGTLEDRLSLTYRQDELAPKREVAEAQQKLLDTDTVAGAD